MLEPPKAWRICPKEKKPNWRKADIVLWHVLGYIPTALGKEWS